MSIQRDGSLAAAIMAASLRSAQDLNERLAADADLSSSFLAAVDKVAAALAGGGKVLFCGNGGSAADAQHLAAELTGRFYLDRGALPAEALHCNTSYLTSVANDYSYDLVYSRLVRGIAKPGDVLVGLSTSGNSKNIIEAFRAANEINVVTIGMTGKGGGALAQYAHILLAIPSTDTPRIQEAHMLLGHAMCEAVERLCFPDEALSRSEP